LSVHRPIRKTWKGWRNLQPGLHSVEEVHCCHVKLWVVIWFISV
jgi:hypothetical protein